MYLMLIHVSLKRISMFFFKTLHIHTLCIFDLNVNLPFTTHGLRKVKYLYFICVLLSTYFVLLLEISLLIHARLLLICAPECLSACFKVNDIENWWHLRNKHDVCHQNFIDSAIFFSSFQSMDLLLNFSYKHQEKEGSASKYMLCIIFKK